MSISQAGCWQRRIVPHLLLAVVGQCCLAAPAWAFYTGTRWSTTASGSPGPQGHPATLTWSLVPDNTTITGEGTSNLISFLDTRFGAGPGGSDLTQRPWFTYFQQSFDRWNELGGITFVYEPNDDARRLPTYSGSLGVRGDIRLGGANIDGANGTLAYAYYPNNGDMVIDTADGNFFANSSGNHRRLRNTVMHELGHTFGLDHVVSNTNAFLMEPVLSTAFDGPQLDDIRGLHWYYGDVLEKSNGGLGNGTATRATSLGSIAAGGTVSIGTDAGPDLVVSAANTDFVSITNNTDVDFFSFSIFEPLELDATLTPLGGVFNQGPEDGTQSSFDANARNDLALSIFNTNGTSVLATANNVGAGAVESLMNVSLPTAGQYYARVTGASADIQLYRLDLSVARALMLLAGDYNQDGTVDAIDYTVWRDSFGQTGTGLAADGNNDLVVNETDYTIWKTNFGTTAGSGASLVPNPVPEPAALVLALVGFVMSAPWRRLSSA